MNFLKKKHLLWDILKVVIYLPKQVFFLMVKGMPCVNNLLQSNCSLSKMHEDI